MLQNDQQWAACNKHIQIVARQGCRPTMGSTKKWGGIVTFGCKSYRSVAIGILDMPRWCDTPIVATIAQDSAIDIAELR